MSTEKLPEKVTLSWEERCDLYKLYDLYAQRKYWGSQQYQERERGKKCQTSQNTHGEK